jgi:hypothetical protein
VGDEASEENGEAPSGYKPRKSVMAFEDDGDAEEMTPNKE